MDAYSENLRDSYVLQTVGHTPRYALPATNYQGYAYAGASGSKIHHPDLVNPSVIFLHLVTSEFQFQRCL